MNSNLTQTVIDIGNINLSGNITPREWFKHITLENGKPDSIAINLLSEIVYLYRPNRFRDEGTDDIVYKKKFHSDLLQKSYSSLADTFGYTKRQVTDAIIRLEKGGFLTRVFRTVRKIEGDLHNVLFIDLHAEAVRRITDLGKNLVSPPSGDPPRYNGTPPNLKRETNTKNTTKIKDKNIKKILERDFQRFWEAYPKKVARATALKAFSKAIAKTDIEKILESVKVYTETKDPNFYANPATWLNGEQWLDEYNIETKAKPISTELKKRYGVDKMVCEAILKARGESYFLSYVENSKAEFSEVDDNLKLTIKGSFTCDRLLDDCTSIIESLGYNYVVRDIID